MTVSGSTDVRPSIKTRGLRKGGRWVGERVYSDVTKGDLRSHAVDGWKLGFPLVRYNAEECSGFCGRVCGKDVQQSQAPPKWALNGLVGPGRTCGGEIARTVKKRFAHGWAINSKWHVTATEGCDWSGVQP